MFRLLAIITMFICFAGTAAPAVKELELYDDSRARPVKVRLWFDDSRGCQNHDCFDKAPLMVFSHGAFGSPREYNWLAFALAANGWNVIAPAHYGESWVYGGDTINPAFASRFDLRVQDLRYVLANLDNLPDFGKLSHAQKIVIAGHSSGGFTVLSLAGAEFDSAKMWQFCAQHYETDKSCQYSKKSPGHSSEEAQKMPQQNVEPATRIDGIIVFDPALGPGVTTSSLAQISYPTLVFGSQNNDFLTYTANAKYYAANLANAQLEVLNDGEGHFIYLDECKHPQQAMGVSLCTDREGVSRKAAHNKMIKAVLTFVHSVL